MIRYIVLVEVSANREVLLNDASTCLYLYHIASIRASSAFVLVDQ